MKPNIRVLILCLFVIIGIYISNLSFEQVNITLEKATEYILLNVEQVPIKLMLNVHRNMNRYSNIIIKIGQILEFFTLAILIFTVKSIVENNKNNKIQFNFFIIFVLVLYLYLMITNIKSLSIKNIAIDIVGFILGSITIKGLRMIKEKKKLKIVSMIIVSVAIIFAWSIFSYMESNGNYILYPPKEHPRLLIRTQYIPDIKKKITEGRLENTWKVIVYRSNDTEHNNLNEIRDTFEAKALRYVIEDNLIYGREAIEMALGIIKKDDEGAFDKSNQRYLGRTLLGISMVYDWCYDLFTEEERLVFVKKINQLSERLKVGYPPIKGSSISGHMSEEMLMRDILGASVAIYDESPRMYELVVSRLFAEYIPSRNFIYQSNMHHQGDSYGPYRYYPELFTTWIFDRMGYGNVFNEQQGQIPYRWIYTRRPDGQFLRDGDSFLSRYEKGYYWQFPLSTMLAAGYYKDAYIQREFEKQIDQASKDPVFDILFSNSDIKGKEPDDLPLTRFFDYPVGSMIARTGWDNTIESNDVIVEMKVGAFHFNNHDHLDSGSFQIYHKGQLAIDSGIYEGKEGGYDSEHDSNYHKRTIAHNCMLFYDPQEKFIKQGKKVKNDGGQRWPNEAIEASNLDELLNAGYKVADIEAMEYGPDKISPNYSYVKGNLQDAYSGKVEQHKRSFVFLNMKNEQVPGVLIVFDKTKTSDKSYEKYWLLHSVKEPTINDNIVTIINHEDHYSGKLVNYALLPKIHNLQINKIGGKDEEFYVFGENYNNAPMNEQSAEEGGSWRIEISPVKEKKADNFLNVMQVMDDENDEIIEPELLELNQFYGVKIADRVVFFNNEDDEVKEEFKIPHIRYEGKLQYLFTDIAPGTWAVYKDGDYYCEVEVDNEGKCLYFENKSGNYTFKKIG